MQEEEKCISQQIEIKRNIKIGAITAILLVILVIIASRIHFYDRPSADKTAQEGMPEVEAEYEYSTLEINDGYEIGICGNPNVENDHIEIYITNVAQNQVWLKAQILDENDNILGETGLIKPNYYVPNIKLKEKIAEDSNIKIKIVEYEIDTYNSKGNVTLNMKLK